MKEQIISFIKKHAFILIVIPVYIFLITCICACAWNVITRITPTTENCDVVTGAVNVDICLSDSTSQNMNANIKHVIEILQQIKSDSIAVEVCKIKK